VRPAGDRSLPALNRYQYHAPGLRPPTSAWTLWPICGVACSLPRATTRCMASSSATSHSTVTGWSPMPPPFRGVGSEPGPQHHAARRGVTRGHAQGERGAGGGGGRLGPGQRLGSRRSQSDGGEGGYARGPQAEEATPVEVHRSHVAELQQAKVNGLRRLAVATAKISGPSGHLAFFGAWTDGPIGDQPLAHYAWAVIPGALG